MPRCVGPLPHELVAVPFRAGAVALSLWCVRDLDRLLDRLLQEQGHVADDDIPYYAHLWPAARVLAAELAWGPSLAGKTVLELGCGLGLAGGVAALRGAQVTFTDLLEEALELCRRNVAHWGVQERCRVQRLDWRAPDAAPADILLLSDVLYEARFAPPLAAALATLLGPRGVAWMADPERPHLPAFVAAAEAAGLVVVPGPRRPVEDGGGVRLYSVHRAGGPRIPAPWEETGMDVNVVTVVDRADLERAFALRREVFVQEQGVPAADELDELDAVAVHAVVLRDGAALATGRLVLPAPDRPYGKIGRMAVRGDWRRHGLGTRVLAHLTAEAQARGITELRLSAQEHAVAFYARLGYQACAAPHVECGIVHVWMRRSLVP